MYNKNTLTVSQIAALKTIEKMVIELDMNKYEMFNCEASNYRLWRYIHDGNYGTINTLLASVDLPPIDYKIDYVHDIPSIFDWDDGTYPFNCEEAAENYVYHTVTDICFIIKTYLEHYRVSHTY